MADNARMAKGAGGRTWLSFRKPPTSRKSWELNRGMGKAKRKPRPSMPHWWWLGQDGCWFCRNRNNCNQCKAARADAKHTQKLARKRDRMATKPKE